MYPNGHFLRFWEFLPICATFGNWWQLLAVAVTVALLFLLFLLFLLLLSERTPGVSLREILWSYLVLWDIILPLTGRPEIVSYNSNSSDKFKKLSCSNYGHFNVLSTARCSAVEVVWGEWIPSWDYQRCLSYRVRMETTLSVIICFILSWPFYSDFYLHSWIWKYYENDAP